MGESTFFIDAGNSRLKLWACRGRTVLARHVLTHDGQLLAAIMMLAGLTDVRPSRVMVASVLGREARQAFVHACLHVWAIEPEFAVVQALCQKVSCAYERPETLGVDRWLGVLAVADGRNDYCVADCGTALTIDVLERSGRHLGGFIQPGLDMMVDSLLRDTRQVRVTESTPRSLGWGTTTSEAVRNGSLLSAVASLRLAVELFGKMHGRAPQVVLTGGNAPEVAQYYDAPSRLEPELLLTGLQRYFQVADI